MSSSRTRRVQLQGDFWESRHDPSQPIAVWIDQLDTAAKQLSGIRLPPSDQQIADCLIRGLDESWATFRDGLMLAPDDVSLIDIISALEAHENSTLALNIEDSNSGQVDQLADSEDEMANILERPVPVPAKRKRSAFGLESSIKLRSSSRVKLEREETPDIEIKIEDNDDEEVSSLRSQDDPYVEEIDIKVKDEDDSIEYSRQSQTPDQATTSTQGLRPKDEDEVSSVQSQATNESSLENILSSKNKLLTEWRSLKKPSKKEENKTFEVLVKKNGLSKPNEGVLKQYTRWCSDHKIPSFPISLTKIVLWADSGLRLGGMNATMIEHNLTKLEWAVRLPKKIWKEFFNLDRFRLWYPTDNGAIRRVACKPKKQSATQTITYFETANYKRTNSPDFLVPNPDDTLNEDNEAPKKIKLEDFKDYKQLNAKSDDILKRLSFESEGFLIDAELFRNAFWNYKVDGKIPFQDEGYKLQANYQRTLWRYLDYCQSAQFIAFPITLKKLAMFSLNSDYARSAKKSTRQSYIRDLLNVAPKCADILPSKFNSFVVTSAELQESKLWKSVLNMP